MESITEWLGIPFVQSILVGIVTLSLYFILRKLFHSFEYKNTDKKEKTLASLLHSILKYGLTIGYIVYTFLLFNVEVGSILAGAGIIGIIIGFSARSFIKDLLAGLLLIYEKQIQKDDLIKINNTHLGTVEDVGLRFLKIRKWSGPLVSINNGQINTIENYSKGKLRVIEDICISFYEEPDQIVNILNDVCVELNDRLYDHLLKDKSGKLAEPFQVDGLSSLNINHNGYEYRIIGLCNPEDYFYVSNEVRLAIANSLYRHNIHMAELTTRHRLGASYKDIFMKP